jgi:hypothetical protein
MGFEDDGWVVEEIGVGVDCVTLDDDELLVLVGGLFALDHGAGKVKGDLDAVLIGDGEAADEHYEVFAIEGEMLAFALVLQSEGFFLLLCGVSIVLDLTHLVVWIIHHQIVILQLLLGFLLLVQNVFLEFGFLFQDFVTNLFEDIPGFQTLCSYVIKL